MSIMIIQVGEVLSQDYTHPEEHNLRTYDMIPGFKPYSSTEYCFDGYETGELGSSVHVSTAINSV